MTGPLDGLDTYPAYYAHMGPANAAGPDLIDLSPPAAADTGELAARIGIDQLAGAATGRPQDWAGGHLEGGLHIPLPDLPARLGEVPPGEIWVHCRSGYRAVIAASLLQAAGHPVVAVDDDLAQAVPAGLSLITGTVPGHAA